MRFQIRSGVKAPSEHYGQLIAGGNPFPDCGAALLKVADYQKDQLGGGIPSCPPRPSLLAVPQPVPDWLAFSQAVNVVDHSF
jgi:hypothetical protein